MKSSGIGKNTSVAEVTNISTNGIWLMVNEKEYFLSYEDFPWFKNARIGEVLEVRYSGTNHLYWPKLDIDVELASLENPRQYPLVYK